MEKEEEEEEEGGGEEGGGKGERSLRDRITFLLTIVWTVSPMAR